MPPPTVGLSPAHAPPPVPGRLVRSCPDAGRYVALTFDACASCHQVPGFDRRVRDALVQADAPATIFLGGLWAEEEIGWTAELAACPSFELGNHSWSHPHMTRVSVDRARAEIALADRVTSELTGRAAPLFRPPFGDVDASVVETAGQCGMHTILYDDVTGDPDPALAPDAIVRAVVASAKPGSIVIGHINGRGVHTAELLPALIAGLRARNLTLTTVGDLLTRQDAHGRSRSHAPH